MLVRQTWLWLVFTGLLVTTATAQSRPEPPSDALSARVFHVLDRHCASCHQRSAISQLDARYGGGIDNILDLQATAQDRRLVSPGLPEASPLFTTIMARTMPPPAHLKAEGQEGMSARELLTLYDWLRATDATRTNCATRSYTLTDTDLASASEYLAAKGVIGARTVRFLHLGRPNPQCMPSGEAARKSLAQELSAARLALNSLSWSPVPVSLDLLTTDTALAAIDLALLGWTAEQWETLLARSPYSPSTAHFSASLRAAGTEQPLARADWLASTLLSPDAYYELLRLPDSLAGLIAELDVGRAADGSAGRRIGVFTSPVSRGRRLIERHPFPRGVLWLSNEHTAQAGRPEPLSQAAQLPAHYLTELFLNSPAASEVEFGDATLAWFSLPNGLPAYFIADRTGRRVNDIANSIYHDPAYPGKRMGVGSGCLNCHGYTGPQLKENEPDELAQSLVGNSSDQARSLLQLHMGTDERAAALTSDMARHRAALSATHDDTLSDSEQVYALVALLDRYRRPLLVEELAVELGVSDNRPPGVEQEGTVVLDRSAAEALAAPMLSTSERLVGPHMISGRLPMPASEPGRVHLRLSTPRGQVRIGETLTLTVRADKRCHLTLIGVDPQGRALVLFPNDIEQNNLLEPGVERRIPDPGAPYVFRFRDSGDETIVAICSVLQKVADGIRQDFELQRFTILGNYRSFLEQTWENTQSTENSANESEQPRRTRRRAIAATQPRQATSTGVDGDIQGRTAIRLRVE